jgi:hypothetical protein
MPRRNGLPTFGAVSDYEAEHVDRAMNAIALITAFAGVRQHGSINAASLLRTLMSEDEHPEYLMSAVAAIGAVLLNDLAKATGTSPELHLQALGKAAAVLRIA